MRGNLNVVTLLAPWIRSASNASVDVTAPLNVAGRDCAVPKIALELTLRTEVASQGG